MSLPEVTRALNRTRAVHVRLVLTDFFAGQPPAEEIDEVVKLVADLHTAFTPTAPEEPKNE